MWPAAPDLRLPETLLAFASVQSQDNRGGVR